MVRGLEGTGDVGGAGGGSGGVGEGTEAMSQVLHSVPARAKLPPVGAFP